MLVFKLDTTDSVALVSVVGVIPPWLDTRVTMTKLVGVPIST